MKKGTYYVTTPIYYVNDLPHIGHTFTTVLADILARYKKLFGYDVFFLTGTDEHGQKVEKSARERGMTPKALADDVVNNYYELWTTLNIDYSKFIRTTDPEHEKTVVQLFQKIQENGDIYKSYYEGWYCWGCEAFIPGTQVREQKCPECGKKLEWLKEESYFFRLSKYEKPLLDFYRKNPDFIRPESRYNEVVRFVESGLKDLSISRTSIRWGIPVPGDPEHVIYVWMDALTNYISALGWGHDEKLFDRYWPADVHLVGKDIIRFHCVYWPAFLMSARIECPKQVFGHGWWLRAESKMSKTVGNIVRPNELLSLASPDMVRYYLAREAPMTDDTSFTIERFIQRLNTDLANDLGNLLHRLTGMIHRFHDGKIPDPGPVESRFGQFRRELLDWSKGMDSRVDRLEIPQVVGGCLEWIRKLNGLLGEYEPWRMVKQHDTRAEGLALIGFVLEGVRLVTALLWPVMPRSMETFRTRLHIHPEPDERDLKWGLLKPGTPIEKGEALFPRIDIDIEANESMENGRSHKKSVYYSNQGRGRVEEKRIDIQKFMDIELRVVRIVSAEHIPGAKKLLKLMITDGNETRQIVAGVAQYYQPTELVNKKIAVVWNLKPARIRGVESNGMLLAADVHGRPYILFVPDEVPEGSRIR